MPERKRLYRLKPIVRDCLWGGVKLAAQLNVHAEHSKPGEIVAAGGYGERDSDVIGKGMRLSQLYSSAPDLFGCKSTVFPLTVNLIDAAMPLSVQVHPRDGRFGGKTCPAGLAEAWVVLDCDKGSRVLAGHNAQSKRDFQEMSSAGQWDKLLRYIEAEKGTYIFLPPGTVHSIGAGVRIYEVTGASDAVYRLYDYGREDGSRPLDTFKAENAVYCPQVVSAAQPKAITEHTNFTETLYADTPFVIKRLDIRGPSGCINQDEFGVLTVIGGFGEINGESVEAGNTILITRGNGKLELSGVLTAMLSSFNG